MKTCSKCKLKKPFGDFGRDWNNTSGYTSQCKKCRYDYLKSYRQSDDGKKIVAAISAKSNKKNRNKHKEAQKRNYARYIEKSPRFILYMNLKNALKRRPTDNPVTLDQLMDIWKLQDEKCAISGLNMTWNRGTILPTSISLDRIDQRIGYEENNVRLVCYQVNMFRGKWSDDQMFEMAKTILLNMEAKSSEPTWRPHLVHSEAA